MTPINKHLASIRSAKPPPQVWSRLGTIPADYTSGMPQVIFDGESEPSGKLYPWLHPYVPVANDRVVLVRSGHTWVVIGNLNDPVVLSAPCPTLMFTSGNFIQGLGVWDNGTKITVLQTNGFVVTRSYPDFTFLYSVSLPGTIPNYSARVINCAITNDGFLFVYVRRTTPNAGFMSLFKHDIAAMTSAVHDAPVTDNNRLTGPAYNPFDGMIYEFWADSGTYRLLRWDPAVPGDPTELWTTPGSDFSASDMLSFTEDGGVWFDWMDQSTFITRPRRLDLDLLTTVDFSTLFARTIVHVPNSPSSVWISHKDSSGASLPGVELHSDGSIEDTDCTLFDTSGTARVHCGVAGQITLLYPTSGGTGTSIYATVIP